MKKIALTIALCAFGLSGCGIMHHLGAHSCHCADKHKSAEMCSACKSKKSSCQCASCKAGKKSACECGKSKGHSHNHGDEALSCGH